MPKIQKSNGDQLMHRIGSLIYGQNVVFVFSAIINVLHPLLVQVAGKSPHIAANVVLSLRSLCVEIEKLINPKIPTEQVEKVEG